MPRFSPLDLASSRGRLILTGMAALGLMMGGSAAAADLDGATAPKADPRKTTSPGARLVTEVQSSDMQEHKDDSELMDKSYEPKGIEMGKFLLLPKIEQDVLYDSNIYARHYQPKPDLFTVVRPTFKARSNFEEHSLNVSGTVEQYFYRHYTDDNRLDLQGDVSGRYDLARGAELNGYFRAYSMHEDRSSPDAVDGKEPTPAYGWNGRGGYKQEFGHYTLELGTDVARYMFGNVATASGTAIHNGDRNRTEVVGKARGSYELTPGYSAVTQVSYNTRQYSLEKDDDGYARSSTGYRVEGGVGVDISQLLRGDFLVGYMQQDYEDARFAASSGVSLKGSFNWTPDKVTVIVPALERSVQETTQLGASGMVRTLGQVKIEREVQRNIILTGFVSLARDTFEGIKDHDAWTANGRVRLTYAFTPEVFVAGEINQKNKVSETPTSSFNQTQMMLRLGLQM